MAICSHRYFHMLRICMCPVLQRIRCYCLSTIWHYKKCIFLWMMTDYNNSVIDRKCCYCKICKIQLPAETSTAWFSSLARKTLRFFNRTSLFWALWFQHNCTNPDFNKSQRQYQFEDTSTAPFSFFVVVVDPVGSLRAFRVWTFTHSAQTPKKSIKHDLPFTNRS